MIKYYVEFFRLDDGEYILQSQWYDSVEECYELQKQFDYIDRNIDSRIMCSEWDVDLDTYSDIMLYE